MSADDAFEYINWAGRQTRKYVPSPVAKAVLMVLATHADNVTGECWPGLRLLAKEACTTQPAVIRALDALCDSGLIDRRKGEGPKGQNVYVLHADAGIPPTVKRKPTSRHDSGISEIAPNETSRHDSGIPEIAPAASQGERNYPGNYPGEKQRHAPSSHTPAPPVHRAPPGVRARPRIDFRDAHRATTEIKAAVVELLNEWDTAPGPDYLTDVAEAIGHVVDLPYNAVPTLDDMAMRGRRANGTAYTLRDLCQYAAGQMKSA